jgi:hypothetical protein
MGDSWNDEDYPTPQAIYSDGDADRYPILKEESGGYTWICYVKLLNN